MRFKVGDIVDWVWNGVSGTGKVLRCEYGNIVVEYEFGWWDRETCKNAFYIADEDASLCKQTIIKRILDAV